MHTYDILFFDMIIIFGYIINPLPPSDAVRKQKNILEDLFSSELSQLKKYHPSGNLKFNNLGISQSLKLLILVEKIRPISPKLNFTPNTLGCYQIIMIFFQSLKNIQKSFKKSVLLNRGKSL